MEGTALRGHSKRIGCVTFSPDGLIIASCSSDSSIRLWNLASHACVAVLDGHSDWVTCIAFSPDGETLASGSKDKTICLWDLATNTRKTELGGDNPQPISCIAFSPEGSTFVSGSRKDGTVRLWDVVTGEPKSRPLEGHTMKIASLAFSPDGQLLASASNDSDIRFWDLTLPQPETKFTLDTKSAWVQSIAFFRSSQRVASAVYDKIRLWDLAELGRVGDVVPV